MEDICKPGVRLPTQGQMMLPLLECLSELGGEGRTGEICEALCEKMGVTPEQREAEIVLNGQTHNALKRKIRWTQQSAKIAGLAEPSGRPLWKITAKGRKALKESLPGIIVTMFITDKGVALWADCQDAVGLIEDNSLNLIFTSPPYPLNHPRAYGNLKGAEYLDWLIRLLETWMPKLAKDGSIVLNLMDTYIEGAPFVDLYQERLLLRLNDDLGVKLCQRYAWHNPCKMPAASWVTINRIRVKQTLENIFWLSPSDAPFADNRQVLKPYSRKYQSTLSNGKERQALRPMGYGFHEGQHLKDNGGSIPGNLLTFAHSTSTGPYFDGCRKSGLPIQPARMPKEIPSYFIKLLTRMFDTVWDPCAGSITTGEAAEELGRYWIATERIREYVQGAAFRFPNARLIAGNRAA